MLHYFVKVLKYFCRVLGVLWDIADKKVDKEIKIYEVDEPFKSRPGTGLKWVS